MSEPKIHKAIIAVMREIGAIGKDSKNEQQNYNYRSIEQVYDRVQPLFAKHGIYSYPKVTDQRREAGKTSTGKETHYAILTVEYTFAADDGSTIVVTVVGEGMDMSDKASNKAMAAAHKYALCQVLNIPYEVIDPDKFTPEWSAKLHGGVTFAQLGGLKRSWETKHNDLIASMSPDEQRIARARWVHDTVGRDFDVGDFRQWIIADLEKCQEALG